MLTLHAIDDGQWYDLCDDGASIGMIEWSWREHWWVVRFRRGLTLTQSQCQVLANRLAVLNELRSYGPSRDRDAV